MQVGLVGAGAIGIRGVLDHLTMPDVADVVTVSAICDPVPGRAEEAARRFGVPAHYLDYADLLASDEIDAVTLATPIALHYEQGLAAIEAGKHVHFHKTMATSFAEARHLIELAEKRGVRLVASPGQMSLPHNQLIRALIRSGEIGELAWAITGEAFGSYHESEAERTAGRDPVNPSWYWRRPGGGPLYDMTVYGLHTLTGILGPAKSVTAMSGSRVPVREFGGMAYECDADDNSFGLLDFGEAQFAVIYGSSHGSVTSLAGQPTFFGSKGTIVGTRVNGVEVAQADNAYATGRYVTGQHRAMSEAHVFQDLMELVYFVSADVLPVANAQHAAHVIEIIEKLYASAETGTRQDLKSSFPEFS